MIRKIDTQLNFRLNLLPSVYYNRHYEPRRGYPFESRTTNVRAVAARVGEARRRDQRFDFPDRAEPSEPFGEFLEKGSRRHSHGARRFFHVGSRRPASGVFSASVELRLVGSRLAKRSMSILHERYAPNADTGEEMLTHAGEEGGVIVKGKIELTVGGESRILGPGDAYYFKSSLPHRFRNIGRDECEIVSASSPPTF